MGIYIINSSIRLCCMRIILHLWIRMNLISWKRYACDKIYEKNRKKSARNWAEKSGKNTWGENPRVLSSSICSVYRRFFTIFFVDFITNEGVDEQCFSRRWSKVADLPSCRSIPWGLEFQRLPPLPPCYCYKLSIWNNKQNCNYLKGFFGVYQKKAGPKNIDGIDAAHGSLAAKGSSFLFQHKLINL